MKWEKSQDPRKKQWSTKQTIKKEARKQEPQKAFAPYFSLPCKMCWTYCKTAGHS